MTLIERCLNTVMKLCEFHYAVSYRKKHGDGLPYRIWNQDTHTEEINT